MALARLSSSRGHRLRPRILICTPEITELPEGMGNAAQYVRAKGGGMGDISAALIRYLHEDGRFQLHVALPKYEGKFQGAHALGSRELDRLAPQLRSKGVHLIQDSAFSRLTDVYDEDPEYTRLRRAEALQRYMINHLLDLIRPDVVHCNDWMTGLVPAAAREKGFKSLFTLHNVFTERETPEKIDRGGIDVRRFFNHLYFEQFPGDFQRDWRWNRIDFTASGIHAADLVNTVSKTFLEEIVAGEFEHIIPPSIRHAIREKYAAGQACAILNAPSDTVDPARGTHSVPFDHTDVMDKKAVNKRAFQEKLGLAVEARAPLFLWPSRLYPQKGPELLLGIAERFIRRHGAQIALVASGDRAIERSFAFMAAASGGAIGWVPFREDLSELGKAGSDFVLMPSRYEPCGLPQMECPRFGTLPVARLTGGLRDTVTELDVEAGTGNGFVFEPHTPEALESAMERAVRWARLPEKQRQQDLSRVMRESFERFNLARMAREYIEIYESLISGSPVRPTLSSS
jgi:ADP-glucose type glycogen/starch synthase